jgi:hypothetical protein
MDSKIAVNKDVLAIKAENKPHKPGENKGKTDEHGSTVNRDTRSYSNTVVSCYASSIETIEDDEVTYFSSDQKDQEDPAQHAHTHTYIYI